MPWTKPTLETLRARTRQDVTNGAGVGNGAFLRFSVEQAVADALAGASDGLYGYLDWIARNMIPSEDSDIDSVLRHANNHLDVPQVAATPAQGSVLVTGTGSATLPAGTEFSTTQGVTYTTDAFVQLSSGFGIVAITAVEPGDAGNQPLNAEVFLSEPVPGINDRAVSTNGLTGGSDAEGALSVLARLRTRWKSAPRGGSDTDYQVWAESIGGVDRAYVFSNDPKTGWVRIVCLDESETTLQSGAASLSNAQTLIDSVRPGPMGGATVQAPTSEVIATEWSGVPVDARSNLESAVTAYLRAATSPGATISQSEIENAGQAATGVPNTATLVTPDADVSPAQVYGVISGATYSYV